MGETAERTWGAIERVRVERELADALPILSLLLTLADPLLAVSDLPSGINEAVGADRGAIQSLDSRPKSE